MKNDTARMEEVFPQMQEQLNAGFSVGLCPQGVSMEPLLSGGRDSVILSPVSAPLKKSDIILYRRQNGQFILHRIVGIKNGQYVCQGDNQYVREYPVMPDQVIAVVTSFTRDGRYFEVNDLKYRLYCSFWPFLRLLRRVYRKVQRILKG